MGRDEGDHIFIRFVWTGQMGNVRRHQDSPLHIETIGNSQLFQLWPDKVSIHSGGGRILNELRDLHVRESLSK